MGEIYLNDNSDQRPAKPLLALRVGITGARRLSAGQVNRIQTQLRTVLGLVKQEMERLAKDTLKTGDFYTHEPGIPPEVKLRMISPLARGADRLAALAALEVGYQLYVPMPFAQAEYEKDFTGSEVKLPDEVVLSAADDLAEFRRLRAAASARLEIDGDRHANPELADDSLSAYSYEAVGRFVVRHSDVLIAVWDGKPSNGRGGTAEIVYHAAATGIPVWWINASEDTDPVWIADVQDLPSRDPLPANDPPNSRLQAHLNHLVTPPPKAHRHEHGWIGNLGTGLRAKTLSSAAVYFAEEPRRKTFLWILFSKTHSRVMKWASRVSTPWTEPCRPEDPVARYWFDFYRPADLRAGEYASRYRSGYLMVIFLTTLALFLGALALGFALLAHGQHNGYAWAGLSVALMELVTLISIVVLVATSLGAEWQERSIEYRLLAELFRKQQTLAPLGWTLPIGNVQQVNDSEQMSWVIWLFAATQRSAPLPQGKLGRAERGKSCRSILEDLIDEQLTYHRGREKTSLNASATFEKWGGRVFVVVLFCVLLKVSVELNELTWRAFGVQTLLNVLKPLTDRIAVDPLLMVVVVLGLFAAVLPGISAAFVAIRSYAELQMLADQSRHMVTELTRAQARVLRLNLQRPLVSQDLGEEAATVATLMLHDLEGWGRLFQGKMMEAS
jgi:hypothetical protein